jgi:hypothetical protein
MKCISTVMECYGIYTCTAQYCSAQSHWTLLDESGWLTTRIYFSVFKRIVFYAHRSTLFRLWSMLKCFNRFVTKVKRFKIYVINPFIHIYIYANYSLISMSAINWLQAVQSFHNGSRGVMKSVSKWDPKKCRVSQEIVGVDREKKQIGTFLDIMLTESWLAPNEWISFLCSKRIRSYNRKLQRQRCKKLKRHEQPT